MLYDDHCIGWAQPCPRTGGAPRAGLIVAHGQSGAGSPGHAKAAIPVAEAAYASWVAPERKRGEGS